MTEPSEQFTVTNKQIKSLTLEEFIQYIDNNLVEGISAEVREKILSLYKDYEDCNYRLNDLCY